MLTQFCTFAAATAGPGRPAQFSVPHSPVANPHTRPGRWLGITFSTGCNVPVTAELITFVFQFMLMVMSLYGLNLKPLGGGFVGGGSVGGGSVGGGVVPPQLPFEVHG